MLRPKCTTDLPDLRRVGSPTPDRRRWFRHPDLPTRADQAAAGRARTSRNPHFELPLTGGRKTVVTHAESQTETCVSRLFKCAPGGLPSWPESSELDLCGFGVHRVIHNLPELWLKVWRKMAFPRQRPAEQHGPCAEMSATLWMSAATSMGPPDGGFRHRHGTTPESTTASLSPTRLSHIYPQRKVCPMPFREATVVQIREVLRR